MCEYCMTRRNKELIEAIEGVQKLEITAYAGYDDEYMQAFASVAIRGTIKTSLEIDGFKYEEYKHDNGCEWLPETHGFLQTFNFPINYCPMCGAKLTSEDPDEIKEMNKIIEGCDD